MFYYKLGNPFGIFRSDNGVISPRLARFHYLLTPSNSFFLGKWTSAGMTFPHSNVKPLTFFIIVDFEQIATAITLHENGFSEFVFH